MAGLEDRVDSGLMALKPPWDTQTDTLSRLETQPGVWEQSHGWGIELGSAHSPWGQGRAWGHPRGAQSGEGEAAHQVTCWGVKLPKKQRGKPRQAVTSIHHGWTGVCMLDKGYCDPFYYKCAALEYLENRKA